MFNRDRSPLSLGLSETVITLLQTLGRRTTPASVLAQRTMKGGDDDAGYATLKTLLTEVLAELQRPGQPVGVVLADRWVRYFMVTPPQNARYLEDCQAALEMRFQALYGDSMDTWHVASDWSARRPFLACAMPKNLLAALQDAAVEHGMTLTTVMPHFIAAWNVWRKDLNDADWFATLLGKHLTLGMTDPEKSGQLIAIRSTPLLESNLQSQTWLAEHAAREALRLNLPEPQQIKLCGEVPQTWLGDSMGKMTGIRLGQDIDIRPMNAGIVLAACGMGKVR